MREFNYLKTTKKNFLEFDFEMVSGYQAPFFCSKIKPYSSKRIVRVSKKRIMKCAECNSQNSVKNVKSKAGKQLFNW